MSFSDEPMDMSASHRLNLGMCLPIDTIVSGTQLALSCYSELLKN